MAVVFSTYFLMFEMATLIYIFALTAVYFGIFALYGRFTKRNLSGFRPFIIGGLIFLLVVSVLSLFLPLGRVGPHCVPDRYCAVFGYHRL